MPESAGPHHSAEIKCSDLADYETGQMLLKASLRGIFVLMAVPVSILTRSSVCFLSCSRLIQRPLAHLWFIRVGID